MKKLSVNVLGSLILILFITGFSESPPKEVKLRNNSSSPTASGYTPSGQSADFNSILRQLPARFNCTLPEGTSELQCEICNCVHENGNEPPEGRIAVNRVVYTRAISGHYPRTACGVIRQPWQFSWYNQGNSTKHVVLDLHTPTVRNCVQTSADSQQYIGQWFASNYYNPHLVSPNWASGCRGFVNIGNHRFATGGCYGVRPNTSFIEQNQPGQPSQSTPATSWLEEIFSTPLAHAGINPVEDFLKKNNQYKLKDSFTSDVQKNISEKRNPAAIEGDFNGDGKLDYVSILVNGKKHQMMFFISQAQGFSVKAKSIPEAGVFYLSKVSKEKVKKGLPNNKARDLVQLEVFMGPTESFYVEGNKVLRFKGELHF